MTAEDLFEAWRKPGSAYWGELTDTEKWQWEAVHRAVTNHADDKFKEGYNTGHDDGYSEGWDEGYDQAQEDRDDE